MDLYGAHSKRVHGDDDDWRNRDWEERLLAGYSDIIIMMDKFGHVSFIPGLFLIAISLGLRLVWEGTR